MKKLLLVLSLSLLVLTGCSADAYATVTDSNTAVVSFDDTSFTKGQFYDAMISTETSKLIVNKLINLMYDETIQESDAIIQEADKLLEDVKASTKEYFTTLLQYYGFASEDSYYRYIITNLKQKALVQKYISDTYDTLITTYLPRKVRILQTGSQEDAEKALAEIKAGADFSATAANYGNSNFKGQELIVYTQSENVSPEVIVAVSTYTEPGLVQTVIANKEGTLFNVVEIIEADPSNFKEAFSEMLLNETDIASEAMLHYVKKGNFTVYDLNVYNALLESNPDYLRK